MLYSIAIGANWPNFAFSVINIVHILFQSINLYVAVCVCVFFLLVYKNYYLRLFSIIFVIMLRHSILFIIMLMIIIDATVIIIIVIIPNIMST